MLENLRNLTAHDKGNTFKVIRTHLEALYRVCQSVKCFGLWCSSEKGENYYCWI